MRGQVIRMASPEGFEPPTLCFVGRRSGARSLLTISSQHPRQDSKPHINLHLTVGRCRLRLLGTRPARASANVPLCLWRNLDTFAAQRAI